MSITYFTIAYTIDTLLSIYLPQVPWLTMRQNTQSPVRLGQTVGFEYVHGQAFHDRPIFGRISHISYFVRDFVIVMVSMDPQAFASSIYLAIPRQWIILPLLPTIKYRLSHHSLPRARFIQFLNPSHGVYYSDRMDDHRKGSRTVEKIRNHG